MQDGNSVDNLEDVPMVWGERPGGTDIRSAAADVGGLRYEDLRELKIESPADVVTLLTKYAEVNVPKDPGDVFLSHLVQRKDSWFVEVGEVGLVYFTNIGPRFSAVLNILFWDGKLPKARAEFVRYIIFRAAELFDLQRVSASTTPESRPLAIFLQDRIGMKYEGTLRSGMRLPDGSLTDASIFSLLREEINEWQLQTISSAQL